MPVTLGLDRLFSERPALVSGKRVGLATNQAARDSAGRSCVRSFVDAGVRVERLFAPEHGYDLAHAEGARFGPGRHPEHGIPIAVFYGDGMRLTAGAVEGLDLLVYDLPNVGARCHTYLANLVEAVRFSSRERFPLLVLDRPNVLGGLVVSGPVTEPGLTSDVAPVPLPFRHGLTAAEICRWLALREGLSPQLEIVEMSGWTRSMWHSDTDISWQAPSPNLATFEAAACYPATVWIEGTNLSEGRGSERPFESFGAPWLQPGRLLAWLQRQAPTGVDFSETAFTPARSKYTGQLCRGLRLEVRNRELYRPLELGLSLVAEIRRSWPESFEWVRSERTGTHFIDRLLGTSSFRRAADEGEGLADLLESYGCAAATFAKGRGEFAIYD